MSKPTERVEACLRACDGLTTVDLAGNKRGWLAELCQDAVKLDEPYRAGAQKCLQIVKEMRESLVRSDGTDYGILSRVEYRLQKVVDAPIAPSTTLTEQDIQRFRVGDILFNDEQAKMFCDLAMKGLRADAASARLDAILDEIDEFLEDQQDVRDGADGVQLPNKAMSLLQELRDARTKSATTRIPPSNEAFIVVKIMRPEDYKDVIPDLVLEDAMSNPHAFDWEIIE